MSLAWWFGGLAFVFWMGGGGTGTDDWAALGSAPCGQVYGAPGAKLEWGAYVPSTPPAALSQTVMLPFLCGCLQYKLNLFSF